MKCFILILCLVPWMSGAKIGNRNIMNADVHGDHIWLIMQRDITWDDDATFKLTVKAQPNGDERVVTEGITWADLSQQSATDGALEGQSYAVLVDGLEAMTTYKVKEYVTQPDGEVTTSSMTYRTKGDDLSDCPKMNVCPNGAGAWIPAAKKQNQIKTNENRNVFRSDVGDNYIWLIMQKDVNWPNGITFEVIVKDAVTQERRVVQEPVTWPVLAQQFVASGQLKGYPFGILADNLTPGRNYVIEETVRNTDDQVVFWQEMPFTTTGGDIGREGEGPRDQGCVRMRVCPVGDGTYVPMRSKALTWLIQKIKKMI